MSYINEILSLEQSFYNLFYEELYLDKATVYHRTNTVPEDVEFFGKHPKQFLSILFKKGFEINKARGNTHGYGFYSYFKLESSNQNKGYGNTIYKFQISSLKKFLYFNYEDFCKSTLYSIIDNEIKKDIIDCGDYFLNEKGFVKCQMIHFGFKKYPRFDDYRLTGKKIDDTANLYSIFNENLYKLIDGVIFDDILVAYTPRILIPVSYSLDDGKTWEKSKDIKDINNKKRLMRRSNLYINLQNNKNDRNISFINKAKISKKSQFEISKGGEKGIKVAESRRVIWKKGKWLDGTWENGTWEDGHFIDGLWEDGTWRHGYFGTKNETTAPVWTKGDWLSGDFYSGMWRDGTWTNGNFKGGLWKNGIWKYGYFGEQNKESIWENGTWEDGHFIDGHFKEGTWKKGYFKKGFFKAREWEDGFFGSKSENKKEYLIKEEEANFVGSTWIKGTWWSGIWRGSKWMEGEWYGGEWHGGKWLGGKWHGGKWLGGEWLGGEWYGGWDKNGNWHEKGDSPNKWNI